MVVEIGMSGIAMAIGWLGTRPDFMILVALILVGVAMFVARRRSA